MTARRNDMTARLEVLNPVANTLAKVGGMAPRPNELSNKRVGLYWNAKPNADIALHRVEELLTKRFSHLTCELVRGGKPGTKEQVDQAKDYDLVVAASGD